MANIPPLLFARSAMQANILPVSPVGIDNNLNAALYSQERRMTGAVASDNIWAYAMPCPYKYWFTIAPFDVSRVVCAVPAQRVAYMDEEIPEGAYFLPVFNTGGSSLVVVSSYDNYGATGTILAGHTLRVPISATIGAADVSVTCTISGVDGYTLTKTILAADQFSLPVFEFYLPTPWDVNRTFTLSWSVYLSFVPSITAIGVSGVVLTTDIPDGAVAAGGWTGRTASVRTAEAISAMPLTGRNIREWHRYRGNFQLARYIDFANRIGTRYTGGATAGSFGARSVSWQPNPMTNVSDNGDAKYPWVTDIELPYCGKPVWYDGAFHATAVLSPPNGYIRRCVSLWVTLTANITGAYTIELQRNPEWSTTATGRYTFASFTVSHVGSGAPKAYKYPGPYPITPDADGGRVGFVTARCLTLGTLSCGVAWALDDFLPSPIAIPTTDGKAIPASVVESSLVPLKMSQAIEVSGNTITFADIPADVELFHFRFNGLARGIYRCNLRQTGGAIFDKTAIWGVTEAGEWSGLVEDGDPVFVAPTASYPYWGDFGKSTWAPPSSNLLESVTVDAITPVPWALSLGDNQIADTAAHFGYATLADAGDSGQCLTKFTAPAAGKYRFVLRATSNAAWSTVRLGLWASRTDPLCIRQIPDAVEPSMAAYVTSTFASAPPTPSGGAGSRSYIIKDALVGGDWEGLEGKRARGYYNGNGAPIVYTIDDLPVGFQVFGGSPGDFWYWSGSAWVQRKLEYLRYEADLASGETINFRVANVSPTGEYGGRFLSVVASGYLIMTVSAL